MPKKYKKMTPYFANPSDEQERKILEVISLIRKGYSKQRIIETLNKKYGYVRDYAYHFIHDAWLRIADKFKEESDKIMQIQLERVHNILEQAIEANDKKSALSALDMINKLYALYVDKHNVNAVISEWNFNYANETQKDTEE